MRTQKLIISIPLLLGSSITLAAGFSILEQGSQVVSHGVFGGPVLSGDPATTFHNPAGMSYVTYQAFEVSALVFMPKAEFRNGNSTLNQAVGGSAISDTPDSVIEDTYIIPSFFYVKPLNEKWRFGLSITSPFGFGSEYKDGWAGRYHALKSELQSLNINPVVSYKLNENLSVGFGVSLQYIDMELTNAVDFSTICLGNPLTNAICGNPNIGLTTPGDRATDGKASFEGDSTAYGYNLGMVIDASEQLRFNIHYRSKIKHTVKGQTEFISPSPDFVTLTGAFVNTGTKTDMTLPDLLTLSARYQSNDKLALLAEVSRVGWSSIDKQVVYFDNPLQPTQSTPSNWKDIYRYAVGMNYQIDSAWVVSTGLLFDDSPIKDNTTRSPRVPNPEVTYILLGANRIFPDDKKLHFGLVYGFEDTVTFNNTETGTGHTLRGEYDISSLFLFAGLQWQY